MATGGETSSLAEDERTSMMDIDDVHMVLQVEQEQIQKRTFTNWINAQLSKRSRPTSVQDLFSDLRDGTRLLDLLEVMTGQPMKREKGHGLFQQRGNIETALNFLRTKSIKLVNINIPDILEGKPSIVLGLIWTIILHCHIEELASALSFGSRSSSLDSLSSLDSASGSPVSSPIPRRTSPLHTRFRITAKKSLLLWVRDQCHKVGCTASVKDFKSSWRSGELFLAILCSLRPDLVDLSQVQTSSHLEKLEKAFHLAEKELGIPRLLEPEDIDVSNPDDKSIMTYVAQFLQYSNDLPSADDEFELQSLLSPTCLSPVNLPSFFTPAVLASPLHQGSPNQKAREMTRWLQRAYQELLEAWTSAEVYGYAEKYQAFQNFVSSYYEQRSPVIPLLNATKRSAKPSEDQQALRKTWDTMEEKIQEYRAELDVCLPAPLNILGQWLQHMEAVLSDESDTKDHARAARDARNKQERLEVLVKDISEHSDTLHHYRNTDENGFPRVPDEKLEEIKRRFTSARVVATYHNIKLQYREQMHHVYDLLGHLKSKLTLWRGPYGSQESVLSLLQDWHDTIDKQGLVSRIKDELHKLRNTAVTYTNNAGLAEDLPVVNRQVKELEDEERLSTEATEAVRGTMDRVVAAWESYKDCPCLLQVLLGQEEELQKESSSLSERSSRQAQLNEVGNFLMEMCDATTSRSVSDELSRLNMLWADFIKRTKFAVPQPIFAVPGVQAAQGLMQEIGWVLREAVEVSSGPLRKYRNNLQRIVKKTAGIDFQSFSPSQDCSEATLQKLRETLPQMLETVNRVDQGCESLQRASSLLEGRLAGLENWSTEAQEICLHLKECQRRGQRGPYPMAKALIPRGLLLEGQVVTEVEDLQVLLASVKKSCPLPHFNASGLQDRAKRTVLLCQEAIEMLSCQGVKREGQSDGDQPPPKVIVRAYRQPEPQSGTFQKYQAQMFSETSRSSLKNPVEPQNPQSHSSLLDTQVEATDSMQPKVPTFTSPLFLEKHPKDPTKAICQVQQTEVKLPLLSSVVGRTTRIKPQLDVQVISLDSGQTSIIASSESLQTPSSPSSNPSTMLLEQNFGTPPKSQSQITPKPRQRVLSKSHSLPLPQEPLQTQSSSPTSSQITGHKKVTPPRTPNEQHSGTTPKKLQAQRFVATPHQRQKVLAKGPSFPQTHEPSQSQGEGKGETKKLGIPPTQPVVPHVPLQNEVYGRAQALAKSRLERAKHRVQEHIQEIIAVFSNTDFAKKQVRRKQAASRLFRPAVLEQFLEAVTGLNAFCSDDQLKDMDLLSESVKAQWEV